jgi:hypothetical protein
LTALDELVDKAEKGENAARRMVYSMRVRSCRPR